MGKTSIEWTDKVWNPIRGCTAVSPGCKNCYAAAMALRFSGPGQAYDGLVKKSTTGLPQWTGEVRVIEDHLDDPLHWKKPVRVFVNSMSDLFHEELSDQDVARIYAVMAACHHRRKGHVFQVLTKRPERARSLLNDQRFQDTVSVYLTEIMDAKLLSESPPRLVDLPWPLPNVWMGTSVEDQERADERIPHLVGTPAVVRFLSCEPLLGPVRLPSPAGEAPLGDDLLHWVIVGGESGQRSRPMDAAWVRSLVKQCRLEGISVFVKQMGSVIAKEHGCEDSKGGDMDEWPADLRVREMPGVAAGVQQSESAQPVANPNDETGPSVAEVRRRNEAKPDDKSGCAHLPDCLPGCYLEVGRHE